MLGKGRVISASIDTYHVRYMTRKLMLCREIDLEEEKTAVTFFCVAMAGRCMVANSIVTCIYKTGAHNLSSDGWEQRTILDANGVRRSKGKSNF